MRLGAFFAGGLAAFQVSAAVLDLEVPAGKFEDCEFLGHQSSEVQGTFGLSLPAADSRWAPAVVLVLRGGDAAFRLTLAAVSRADRLVARYEVFSGNRRIVAENLAQAAPGDAVPFRLGWAEPGRVVFSVAGLGARELLVDFKPEQAFAVISGAKGHIRTRGPERLDCSRRMAAPRDGK